MSAAVPPAPPRAFPSAVGLLIALVACFTAAGVGASLTNLGLRGWYPELVKPGWTPPNWLFGPVWTTLYAMMAVAAWRVWRRTGLVGFRGPLGLFAVQLALNVAWSGLFFALRSPGLGVLDIAALWLAIAATIAAFWRVDRWASALMVPYLLWVSYASALNVAIWRLN